MFDRGFLAGLVVFLIGHILYVLAFNDLVRFTEIAPLLLIGIGVFSSAVFAWLRPHLGSLQLPVSAYVLVITAMLWSACAVYFETAQSQDFRLLALVGATAFYFSDLAVAIEQFVHSSFTNRAWGLPLYYLGQFLLAFSISNFGTDVL